MSVNLNFVRQMFLKLAGITRSGRLPQLNISTIFLKRISVHLPGEPQEQQKIADFLSSIDQKIDLVATELDHAKTFKKGKRCPAPTLRQRQ